jgi:hypothetical protein
MHDLQRHPKAMGRWDGGVGPPAMKRSDSNASAWMDEMEGTPVVGSYSGCP